MRTCLALDLKNDPEGIAQYEAFHRPGHIWPEIPIGIRAGGIWDMQIYRLGTRLVMIVETAEGVDLDAAFYQISQQPRQPEWAALMARFQQRLPDTQPGEHWAKMTSVFSLNDTPEP